MKGFWKRNWYILVPYVILTLGILWGLSCSTTCEELGCLACAVVVILGLYAAALFSVAVIIVQAVRGKGSARLWWLAPIIALALYGLIATLIN